MQLIIKLVPSTEATTPLCYAVKLTEAASEQWLLDTKPTTLLETITASETITFLGEADTVLASADPDLSFA